MEEFIKRLRRRAEIQKYIAFVALFCAVSIVGYGGFLFVYESPKIAAQDIEQHRKISSAVDPITELERLNLGIHKNAEELSYANEDLRIIQSSEYKGWSINHLMTYYTKDFTPKSPDIRYRSLYELDDLVTEIKGINIYLESDDAIKKYISDREKDRKVLETKLQDYESRREEQTAKHKSILNSTSDVGQTKNLALKDVEVELKRIMIEINDLEHDIKASNEVFRFDGWKKRAEKYINGLLQSNNAFIEVIEKNKPGFENYMQHRVEQLTKQKDIINKLQIEQVNLEDKKSLTLRPSSDIEILKNDNKMVFYVSTNIARLGIMIVTIFLAQVFISIYRYLTKISNFYHARADAFYILTQTDTLKKADLPSLIEMFSNILSPDKVDFGRIPQLPITEAVKGAQSVFGKS